MYSKRETLYNYISWYMYVPIYIFDSYIYDMVMVMVMVVMMVVIILSFFF
jgi:hypothetical protein